jgi:hypothetical protein
LGVLLLVGGLAVLMAALTVYGVLRGDPEQAGRR